MDPVLTEANQKIQNSLEHFVRELCSIRAGRANPTLIENLPVLAYGAKMKLVELGTISSPQPQLLTVQVWDAGVVQDVVKGIQEANLGINPSYEGQLVRLPIPPLTQERRIEFIKLSHSKMEQAKIELRQIRQDIRSSWDRQMEAGEFGEDEFDRRAKLLQEIIDKAIGQIDEMVKVKEEELAQI